MDTEYIAAVDIGGTKMAATIAGRAGPLARVSQPTVKSGSDRALPEQALMLIDMACERAGVPIGSIAALGVASCGPFIRNRGEVELSTPNLCGARAGAVDLPNNWENIPLERVLRERFASVVIENDGVSALVGERSFGAVLDEPNCAYVTWSTGVGFGLCVDGRVLHGKNGNAGHAGHILMSEEDDALCGCGNRGDLEALVSGRNLGNRLNMPTSALFQAAKDGNESAREVALRAAERFGRALYNVTAILDTRVFVIGGSIWQHHGDWLAPVVLREIESRFPALTQGVTLLPAALGPLVTDIGALALVIPQDWIPEWRRTSPWQNLENA